MKQLFIFFVFSLLLVPNRSTSQVRITLVNDTGKWLDNVVVCGKGVGTIGIGQTKTVAFHSVTGVITVSLDWGNVKLNYPIASPTRYCGTPSPRPKTQTQGEISYRLAVGKDRSANPILQCIVLPDRKFSIFQIREISIFTLLNYKP